MLVGSFSKVLCPALRVGYLVVPPDLIEPVSAWLSVSSRHVSTLTQAVLCDFIADGHFVRHLRRMRDVYAERLGALVAGAGRLLRGRLDVTAVDVGLQTVGYLAAGLSADAVAQAAAARDVEVRPLSRYARTATVPEGLQIGFAAADVAENRPRGRGPCPGDRHAVSVVAELTRARSPSSRCACRPRRGPRPTARARRWRRSSGCRS